MTINNTCECTVTFNYLIKRFGPYLEGHVTDCKRCGSKDSLHTCEDFGTCLECGSVFSGSVVTQGQSAEDRMTHKIKDSPFDVIITNEMEARVRTFSKPYVLISIRSRGTYPFGLPKDPNRLAVLSIEFDDCSPKERRVAKPILKKEARFIWSFLRTYIDQIELLVCQCEAGVSRSAGVAAGILKALQLDNSICYGPQYHPNAYVKKVMLNTYEEVINGRNHRNG